MECLRSCTRLRLSGESVQEQSCHTVTLCRLAERLQSIELDSIKESYIKDLNFHYVSEMKEVIELALTKEKVKNPQNLSIKLNPAKAV